jgi:hypothetical protein
MPASAFYKLAMHLGLLPPSATAETAGLVGK